MNRDNAVLGLLVIAATLIFLAVVVHFSLREYWVMTARVEAVKAGHTPAEAACLKP